MISIAARSRLFWVVVLGLCLIPTLSACKKKPKPYHRLPLEEQPLRKVDEPRRPLDERDLSPYWPLPVAFTKDNQRPPEPLVNLGRQLFYDPRFSKNHDLSCHSCHVLAHYGVDGQPKSIGHRGQQGQRNAPSVFNAAGHNHQFWDGRSPNVEEQALVPLLSAVEMAMGQEARVLDTLRSIPGYVEAFKQTFPEEPDPIRFENFGKAIGAFERGLVTPGRWDRFVKGERELLNDDEIYGLQLFTTIGCTSCHSGALVGGTLFEKLGKFRPWPNQEDPGRFLITKNEMQRMTFKVAALRNVAETAPYFHDASSTGLEDAVSRMAVHQLGVELDPEQATAIAVWLKALSGEIDADYIKKPELPASGPDTPKPDPS